MYSALDASSKPLPPVVAYLLGAAPQIGPMKKDVVHLVAAPMPSRRAMRYRKHTSGRGGPDGRANQTALRPLATHPVPRELFFFEAYHEEVGCNGVLLLIGCAGVPLVRTDAWFERELVKPWWRRCGRNYGRAASRTGRCWILN